MPAAQSAAPAQEDFLRGRRTMVDCQIRTFDVTDLTLIARFLDIPRETFLPRELAPFAYSDMSLRIPPVGGESAPRTLLAPAVLAKLIQAAAVKATDKVLDVATGTGYSTAIFAGLAAKVVALETNEARCEAVTANLAAAGIESVPVLGGPLCDGAPSAAPFDVVFVNGAVEGHLDRLFKQLRPGGRLLAIWHVTEGPDKGASRAVRFDVGPGSVSPCNIFDASAPVLPDFRKEPAFVF